jgi:hypothetical protein
LGHERQSLDDAFHIQNADNHFGQSIALSWGQVRGVVVMTSSIALLPTTTPHIHLLALVNESLVSWRSVQWQWLVLILLIMIISPLAISLKGE